MYQLNPPENGTVKETQKRNRSENGTVPFFPSKSPVFPAKQAQKRDTEPKGTIKETKGASFALPDWLLLASWDAYIEMRKAIKKAPTAKAIGMVIKRLEQFRTDGQDPNAILDQSTRNNWIDVYPVKGAFSTSPTTANHLAADEQFLPEAM